MKKAILLVGVLILSSVAVEAGTTSCNATLVKEGVCRDAANTVYSIDAPTSAFQELRNAIVIQGGYQVTVECSQARVDLSDCAANQLGQQISNPMNQNQFADAWIKAALRAVVVKQRTDAAKAAANAGVDANVDLGNP